jgi:hypothetical protein
MRKLLEIESRALIATFDENSFERGLLGFQHKDEILRMLKSKNGFYAFESALHVFPFVVDNWFNHQDLVRWNAPGL